MNTFYSKVILNNTDELNIKDDEFKQPLYYYLQYESNNTIFSVY